MKINDLVKEVHDNAVKHGWYDEPREIGTLLMLVVSELSEALEEIRNGVDPTKTYYSGKYIGVFDNETDIGFTDVVTSSFKNKSVNGIICNKPEGVPSELADAVIRIMDICGFYGIDLENAIIEKMKYNKTRPYKHGGRKV